MRLDHVVFRAEQQLEQCRVLSKALENLLNAPLNRHRVDVGLQSVQTQWEEFLAVHKAITLAVFRLTAHDQLKIREHAYFSANMFDTTHECYLETVAKMTALSEDFANGSDRSSPSRFPSTLPCADNPLSTRQQHNTRLPRIDLPKFNGSLSDWLPFKDLFSSLVMSNRALSPVEKLQYLKTSLTGTAAPLLRNTALTADNLERAWDALLSFFENDRLLVTSAIQTLFTLKKMTKESAAEMENLYTTITQAIRTLETLHRPVQHWDDILVFIVTQRLDAESIKAWELHLGSSRHPPTWQQLSEFLMTRLFSLRAYEKSAAGPSSASQLRSARSHSTIAKSASEGSRPCPLCNDIHYLARCPMFMRKSVKQRNEYVRANGLCFNCIGNHRIAKCTSTKRCTKCGKRHHSSLHYSSEVGKDSVAQLPITPVSTNSATVSSVPAQSLDVTKTVHHAQGVSSEDQPVILLATAQVKALSSHDENIPARVLLDQGSEVTLVTENLVRQLQIPRSPVKIRLDVVGQSSMGKTRGTVRLRLKPRFDSETEITVTAHILHKLTTTLPTAVDNSPLWPHLRNLQLADPHFLKPGKIDIILGAEVYGHLLEGSIVKGPPNAPVAQLTKFGWIVSGPTTCLPVSRRAQSFHCSADRDLSELLERFWKQEEINFSKSSLLSRTEQECEDYFLKTHSRTATGRYVVRLPLIAPLSQLGNSRQSANRMIKHLERKFEINPAFAAAYSKFLHEYETLGHMKRVPATESDPQYVFYLPHHGVIRESSSTTKLRVVFNGSCSVDNGLPLNAILHTGPKLQSDIMDVLLWVRRFRYIVCCDIEKMYRQILVHPDDQPLQRILWQTQGTINRYQLTTVTYGLACAPYLALRVVAQLIDDEGHRFPQAVEAMKKGRYVDDIYGGSDTIEAAREQANQINGLCMAGGLPLRKWLSNHQAILQDIPSEHRSPSSSVQLQDAAVHALGLSWNPVSDCFAFTVTDFPLGRITKRSVMSRTAQIFDPLGLLSPVIIAAKIFIQELWAIKVSWDEPLPDVQIQSWQRIIESLNGISAFTIPRWIGTLSSQSPQIHGFCDASQSAMAAAVYLRTEQPPNGFRVSLLCAKTRVAPLKRMTIPRLELSSAVLLTKLVAHVARTLDLQSSACFMWTDSSIALTWIKNHPSRWKDFVHNRTCLIQETLPQATWNHVRGTNNPADCASRGVPATFLRTHELWWVGPAWLSLESTAWPVTTPVVDDSEHLLEERKLAIARSVNIVIRTQEWELLERCSSLTRLLRLTAICRRVLRRARRLPNSSLHHGITTDELNQATLIWVRIIQKSHYSTELNLLQANRELPRSSQLVRLCPFLDSSGLLRVRGRLEHSKLDPEAKHPYILPRRSNFSTLLIRDAHDQTLHGSTQDTLSYLRNRYWIVGGRAPVRSILLKCVKCARYRRAQAHQLMGQLPPSRVNPTRAFLNSGLDYAGPYSVKTWKGKGARSYKAWIALFVCLSTSAVHLEIVTDYSAEAFLAAYHRFTARRGICATLVSDCGTTFRGADKQLQDLFSKSSTDFNNLASTLAHDGTKWTFNPPAAPHFGGKWEAGVKRVKYHLKRVTGSTPLTFEELSTLLSRIEAVLNSRPLCPLTDDPDDLNVLTPGHFLIGQALTLVPEPDLTSVPSTRLQRWQRLAQMTQEFWKKWSREYLQRFHAIYKWNRDAPPLSVGDLVFVIDERYPPAKWPLGRILQVHPGTDNRVRVATLKTASTTLTRPVVKLCPLPKETPA